MNRGVRGLAAATALSLCSGLTGDGTSLERVQEHLLFSFEDGTTEGWVVNEHPWATPFDSLEVVPEQASHGDYSLRAHLNPAQQAWGAWSTRLEDARNLSALAAGGVLLVDVVVPEETIGLEEIGFGLRQTDARAEWQWQVTWASIPGPGVHAIALPFVRTEEGPCELHLGATVSAGTDPAVFFDQVRVRTTEEVAWLPPTVRIARLARDNFRIDFTGALSVTDALSQPFALLAQATTPMHFNAAQVAGFFRSTAAPTVYFRDDFEGEDLGWTVRSLAGDSGASRWERGTPNLFGDLEVAYSGTHAWGTSLDGVYWEGAHIGLLSPLLDLRQATRVRLDFWQVLDVGDQDEDEVRIFVRQPDGTPLEVWPKPVYTANHRHVHPFFFAPVKVDLPAEICGGSVRLEFVLQSDMSPTLQYGWFIDDLEIVAIP